MKKRFILALMVSVFLTGCRTEASAINGSRAGEEIAADAVDILGADASLASNGENSESVEDGTSEEIDEEKYGSYEQFIDDIRYCVEKEISKGWMFLQMYIMHTGVRPKICDMAM